MHYIDIDKDVRPHLKEIHFLHINVWSWGATKREDGSGLPENMPFDDFIASIDFFDEKTKPTLAIEINGTWYASESPQDWWTLDEIFTRKHWQTWLKDLAEDFSGRHPDLFDENEV